MGYGDEMFNHFRTVTEIKIAIGVNYFSSQVFKLKWNVLLSNTLSIFVVLFVLAIIDCPAVLSHSDVPQ